MTPERWQEVKKVLAGALERTPEQRSVYLGQVCTDPALRREVESLISAHEQDNNFIEQPALDASALNNGMRLGQYTILALIGSGGMGEVYRAHDTRLKRDVAVKILPRPFAKDPERLARFGREARLLASLNHPNIAAIYGLEESGDSSALVMELVEGPTLADRIRRAPIAIEEALSIAKQICDALEYAHERGIVHRDLKPANIKVSRDDSVKILDFGLAKAIQGEAEQHLANSPTLSETATEAGVLLGTAAYMSPEQAKGKPVDRRADIWAFGCVLYEMLTGRRAFQGEMVTETLATIMRAEPDWKVLPAATPMRVRVLLQRCLQKEPRQRLRDIGDARIALDEVLAGTPEVSVASPAPRWRRVVPWALFGATAVAFVALAWIHQEDANRSLPSETVRLQIPIPAQPPLRLSGLFALSPNGRELAWVAASADGVPRIWIRSMDSLEMRSLPGTESVGRELFWSPDSRFIAFDAGGKLRKIEVSGGPAEVICILSSSAVGGSWNKDGVIIFGQYPGPVMRVAATGGVATAVTALDSSHEVAHTVPWFLPDGRHFVYLRDSGAIDSGISIGSLDAKPGEQDSRRLITTASSAAFVPSADPEKGEMLFLEGTALMAQPFEVRLLKLAGDAVRVVAEPIGVFLDYSQFSVSSDGTLTYWSSGDADSQLTRLDAQGKMIGTVAEPGPYVALAVSPDGSHAMLSKRSLPDGNVALWMVDLSRDTNTLFEVGPSFNDIDAVWAPDGRRVIFASDRVTGQMDLYEKAVSGAANAKALLKSKDWKIPLSWSPDGRFLLYSISGGETSFDLWLLRVGSQEEPLPFLRTGFNESHGRFSPDGHWITYVSDESGRNEVYVRPYSAEAPAEAASGSGEKFLVSSNGGIDPMWRGDSKELYYLDPDRKLMAVNVTMAPMFHVDSPKLLFQAPPESTNEFALSQWAPLPDGKNFLFLAAETPSLPAFTVVLNWQALLKK